MKVFWRNEELTEHEATLLRLCLEAHAASAMRPNISTVLLQNAAQGSCDYAKAVSAALMGIGGAHAPLMDTWKALHSVPVDFGAALNLGVKIPGWGSSFEKGTHDPIWDKLRDYLFSHFNDISSAIVAMTHRIHDHGKMVYPNASCYTAATGIALKMPPQILPWLFIQGRLNTWSVLFCQSIGLTEGAK